MVMGVQAFVVADSVSDAVGIRHHGAGIVTGPVTDWSRGRAAPGTDTVGRCHPTRTATAGSSIPEISGRRAITALMASHHLANRKR